MRTSGDGRLTIVTGTEYFYSFSLFSLCLTFFLALFLFVFFSSSSFSLSALYVLYIDIVYTYITFNIPYILPPYLSTSSRFVLIDLSVDSFYIVIFE